MITDHTTNLAVNQLIEQTLALQNVYQPEFFDLSIASQKTEFEKLIGSKKELQVFDHIVAQVEELIKCQNPTIILQDPSALTKAVENHFQNKPKHEYGNWIYYPWANKLVHLLPEKEFELVKTNRNKHKITAEEQSILAGKKIGIMGLSVGQSVAITLAMERSFKELRIADFDELDLSNLNRIRTGIFNLKLKKTVIVAREIAEIDPYLNVTCFEKGITNTNLNDFLTKSKKLDLLIDECDSFDIKINARHLAKKLGIPVLMEGSDRGTIDIERFDLEPNRPVLHGMVAHLDTSNYNNLKTLDDKIPYITAVTGVETLSHRMKASAIEIMASISTWPQLASAVTFGGGITADLSRKILLNQLNISGRFFIDIDELIKDPEIPTPKVVTEKIATVSTAEIEKFIIQHQSLFTKSKHNLPDELVVRLINCASKAPSGGNSQPWRWHYQNGTLHLFMEKNAAQAYLDPQHMSSYLSLGSAIQNLLLSAANEGLQVTWQFTPQLLPTHVANFNFKSDYKTSLLEKKLFAQIEKRHTNRKIGTNEIINKQDLEYLKTITCQKEGLKLTWVFDEAAVKQLAAISAQTDLLRMFIPEAHEDFINREMRWSQEEVENTSDGIGIDTLDLSNNDQVGIRLVRDKKTVKFLQQINGGNAFKRITTQQFTTSAAIGLITMPRNEENYLLHGGMAAQKMWLAATGLNLQIHPVNVPIVFFYKNTVENSLAISVQAKEELKTAEQNFKKIFGVLAIDEPLFMFRVFKNSPSPKRTIRKSTDKILSIGNE
jgi:nitroreductase/molybdopterin/thiamine biosynthesis adenylyltransferase